MNSMAVVSILFTTLLIRDTSKLYPMCAIMKTINPTAEDIIFRYNPSETVLIESDPASAMSLKMMMTPNTVPKNPKTGATPAMVANTMTFFSSLAVSCLPTVSMVFLISPNRGRRSASGKWRQGLRSVDVQPPEVRPLVSPFLEANHVRGHLRA